jgi:hypothetical protein
VVIETRLKPHPIRSRANRVVRPDASGKSKEKFADDPGGSGWEIVREVIACPDCALQREV